MAQVLSQPWMEGLGQSVGGLLTAAPGGGTGSDKDDEAAVEAEQLEKPKLIESRPGQV